MRRKNSIKRYSAMLLALVMLSCGVQSAGAEAAFEAQTETESEVQTAEQTEAETEAPLVFFTEETGSDSIISGMEDAAAVVENMAERIGADGRTVQMVCAPGYTLPVLMYMKFEPNQIISSAFGLSVFTKGRWVDLMDQVIASADHPEAVTEAVISWINDEETPFFYEIEGGRVCRIPADGLEETKTYEGDYLDSLFSESEGVSEEG